MLAALVLSLTGVAAHAANGDRVAQLEAQLHAHLHDHAGIFDWSGAFNLPPGAYSWRFDKVNSVYGAYNETVMHVAITLTDETVASYADDPSPGEIDGDELDELKEATALCSPKNAMHHVVWCEGDAPMRAGVCYVVHFDRAGEDTTLRLDLSGRAGGVSPGFEGMPRVYAIFTEHSPSEFGSAAAGLRGIGNTLFEPLESAPVKGLGMFASPTSTSLVGEIAQDAVGAVALVFSLIGLVLAAAALCVACEAKALANKGTPKLNAGIQMENV